MSGSRSLVRVALLGALVGVAGVAGVGRSAHARTPRVAGPAWISIETPVNPYDASTRNGFLVVHAFHHGDASGMPVTGTAEGLVGGERRSITLQFLATSRPGAYALRKQWPDAGIWTLVIAVMQHENDGAQALVDLGSDGAVTRVQVPTRVGERNLPFPRLLTAREIDVALRQRAKLAPFPTAAASPGKEGRGRS